MTRSNIDDAQSTVAETNAAIEENARIVGTSMRKDVPHALHNGANDRTK